MKLLHFCNLFPNKLGAYEYVLAAIGREFKQHGDELIMVFAAEPTTAVANLLQEQSVRWRVIDRWSDGRGGEHPWRFCIPALRLLRKERPDVAAVHFGNELPGVLLITMCKMSGLRHVRWVWEQDQQIQPPGRVSSHVSKIRLASWFFDRMLAVYDGGRRSFLQRGIADSKISVIYNSVREYESDRASGWLRSELGVSPDRLLLLSTAWLVPRKRLDFLIRALARVSADVPGVDLVLAGGGPERERLERLAADLGVSDRIHFLGQRDDVRDILAEVDILVHSSLAETCTYAITESMCAGIPAIVTDAGAAREQIVDGESGYVVERDGFETFCVRLRGLLEDDEQRARMGASARARWRARYCLGKAAALYHRLYEGDDHGTI